MCQMLVDHCEYADALKTGAALMGSLEELCRAHWAEHSGRRCVTRGRNPGQKVGRRADIREEHVLVHCSASLEAARQDVEAG